MAKKKKIITKNNNVKTNMNDEIDEVRKSVKEHSGELAKLGSELSEIQFNYKVVNKTNAQYWQKRIEEFKRYHEHGMRYYKEVHTLMNIVGKDEAGLFLLSISKLHQLGEKLQESLEGIKQNPSIMSSKDKQQSKWSKDLREQLIEQSNNILSHEKNMNVSFREFYEKHLKKLLED